MEKQQQGVKIFKAIIIYIKQFPDTKVLIYIQLKDLLPKEKNIDNISINKLVFLTFKDTLKQDIGFNKDYNILIYIFQSRDQQKGTNKQIWKTIIDYAFTPSLNFINFIVE